MILIEKAYVGSSKIIMKNKIKSKTEIALKWNAGYKFLENFITFAIGIFLARLLDPSEFGIIAVVLAISSFVNSFVDGGFGSAIVQSKQLKETDLSSIFTLNLIIAITFSTLLFLLSGFIGELFENKIISNFLLNVFYFYFKLLL